jgi:hypothetical protein
MVVIEILTYFWIYIRRNLSLGRFSELIVDTNTLANDGRKEPAAEGSSVKRAPRNVHVSRIKPRSPPTHSPFYLAPELARDCSTCQQVHSEVAPTLYINNIFQYSGFRAGDRYLPSQFYESEAHALLVEDISRNWYYVRWILAGEYEEHISSMPLAGTLPKFQALPSVLA